MVGAEVLPSVLWLTREMGELQAAIPVPERVGCFVQNRHLSPSTLLPFYSRPVLSPMSEGPAASNVALCSVVAGLVYLLN